MIDFNSPPAQLPRSVTFGLEIEMLVAAARRLPEICGPQAAPLDDPHPDDGRWCSTRKPLTQALYDSKVAVAQCLVLAGVNNVRIDDKLPFRKVSDAAQASGNALPKVETKYHDWRVMPEQSLGIEEWVAADALLGQYAWGGVEVASAVFHSRAPADVWVPVTRAQEAQMAGVCRSLASNLRVRFSPSCGLHLHLGLGGEPIPGGAVRRFVAVMWLVEHAVESLCAPWRTDNEWSRPITKASMLAHDNWDEGGGELWGSVQWFADVADLRAFVGDGVWDRVSLAQRKQLLLIWSLPLAGNGGRNLAEAISTSGASARGTVTVLGALLPQDGDCGRNFVANTIEVRYASGTLVARELASWTNLFVRLFQLCTWHDETNAIRLTTLLQGVVCGLGSSGFHAGHELLRQVGLGEDVRVWEAAARRWASAEDYDQVRRSPFVERQW